jgi:hypothetical protein
MPTRDYYQRNLEKCREHARAWKEKNPEYHKVYRRKWNENNPDYFKLWLTKPRRVKEPVVLLDRPTKIKKVQVKRTTVFNRLKYQKDFESGLNRATAAVRNAIRKGILPSLSKNVVQCSLCTKRALIYDHRDYNLPLSVTPVCRSCNFKLGEAIHLRRASS